MPFFLSSNFYLIFQAYFTEKRAAFVSSLVYVLCFLLTSSTPFEWKSVKVTNSDEFDDSNESVVSKSCSKSNATTVDQR